MERHIPPTKPGQPPVETPLPQTPEELARQLEAARLRGAKKAIKAVLNDFSQHLTTAGGHMELFQKGQGSSLPPMMEGIVSCLNTLDEWRMAVRQDRIRFGRNEVGIDTVLIVPEENQPPK